MKSKFFGVISGLFLYFLNTTCFVNAQIVPDGTLPRNSSIKAQGNNTIIEGGTRIGNNLFHSFQQFSIPTNGTVYFNNALDIQNIIGRVTGRAISSIDGLLRINGNANLFLINPNGFSFGSNARLNIGGSFLVGSAKSINFADGTQFRADNPSTSPLLTISIPIGLDFGTNPGNIRVQGAGYNLVEKTSSFSPYIGAGNSLTGLRVRPGKTLALVGGDISLNGGVLTAPGGRIELGSVNNQLVNINLTARGFNLSYTGSNNLQDIRLTQKSLIDTSGVIAGSIQLKGNNLSLTDGSTVLIQNQGLLPAGDINLTAGGTVLLSGTSLDKTISTGVVSETLGGTGSDISISTKDLVLDNGAQLLARTFRAGQGGSLTVNTSSSIQVLGFSLAPLPLIIPSNIVAATFGTGNGGSLNLATQNLSVQRGAQVIAATFGAGRGGDLNINSFNSINLSGYISKTSRSSSSLLAETNGIGNGGNLILKTKNLTLQEGAVLGTLTFQSGLGGNATVNADEIEVNGNNPTSFVPSVINAATFGSGNGGDLVINTAQLLVTNGGRIDTSTLANGKAGNLTISASDSVSLSGTVPGSVNPSLIDSSANILDKNLQLLYHLPPKPSSDSGDLTISTRNLSVLNGANVSVQNQGSGKAGTLTVAVTSLTLDQGGALTASTTTRDGGNINIITKDILLRHAGSISATAGNNGNGGNITIKANTLVALENSLISANAYQGRGGNIQINTQGIFLSPDSDITASSQFGINGTVRIITLGFDAKNALAPLTGKIVNTEQVIANSCLTRRNATKGSFVSTGTGGLPITPYDNLDTDNSLTAPAQESGQPSSPIQGNTTSQPSSWEATLVELENKPYHPWQPGEPIAEGNTIVKTPDGHILLVAAQDQTPVQPASTLVCH